MECWLNSAITKFGTPVVYHRRLRLRFVPLFLALMQMGYVQEVSICQFYPVCLKVKGAVYKNSIFDRCQNDVFPKSSEPVMFLMHVRMVAQTEPALVREVQPSSPNVLSMNCNYLPAAVNLNPSLIACVVGVPGAGVADLEGATLGAALRLCAICARTR